MTWTQTILGNKWDLLDPTPTPVHWNEIAYVLARTPRFNGHTRGRPYSVGQHCCHCHDMLSEPSHRLAALLHDAEEFAVGDITTPVAVALEEIADEKAGERGVQARGLVAEAIKELKARQSAHIFRAAGLPWPMPESMACNVKFADLTMLMTERRDLMAPPPEPWTAFEHIAPLDDLRIQPWSRCKAEREWLDRFLRTSAEAGL